MMFFPPLLPALWSSSEISHNFRPELSFAFGLPGLC